jgi:NADH-quinone oxidoreductase subunit D
MAIDPRTEAELSDDALELFVEGADWESVVDAVEDDRITVNMGPQHPSTHGVLRWCSSSMGRPSPG